MATLNDLHSFQEFTDVTPLPIEHHIAIALQESGTFHTELTATELIPILRNVLLTLVGEQELAGFDLPIKHAVTAMDVEIANQQAIISSEVHIHQPIHAFVRFRYVLENMPDFLNLRVQDNRLEVQEITKRFDIAAKAALRVMNVRKIALRELSDPAEIIKRTLKPQLQKQGYYGTLAKVALQLTSHDTLSVMITAE